MGKEKQIIAERFEVLEELGLGTLGPLMLVRDRRSEWQKRVLRMVEREYAEPAWVQRFEFEFHERTQITHPHLVQLYDFGRFEDRFYYTAEYVKGPTFETWAPGHNIEAVLSIASQVLRGLQAIHAHGFRHGDVKPENIIVLETPAGFHAKLIDPAFVTRPLGNVGRRFSGTPAYLAPETVRFSRLDGRSDLYALGVSLYEAVAGRRPVPGATVHELLRNLDSYAPAELSTIAPGIPPEVAEIIMRLLSKNPIDRFGDANRVIVAFSKATKKELPLELEHGHPDLLAPGMVARENVEELFREFLVHVQGGGTGRHAVLVNGPAGSGLSLMLDELSATAEMENFKVIRTDVMPHEGANDSINLLVEKIQKVTGNAPESATSAVTPLSQTLNTYTSIAGHAPDNVVGLIGQILEAVANHAICIVMDDLHLAGPRRREMLVILLDILRRDIDKNRRICLLGSTNSPASPESLPHLLMRENLAEIIELQPFDLSATKRTLAGILGETDVPDDFAGAVHTASRGLPRAVVNCVRLAVAEEKMSRGASGEWIYPRDLTDIRPDPPEEILKKLIASLDDQTVEVICACATFRSTFNLDDLGNLMRERPKILYPVVRRLTVQGLIREAPDGLLHVSSEFIRKVIASAVPDRHVKANHRRLGMHKLALAERGAGSERVAAAYHLLEAGDRKFGLPLALEVIDNCLASGDAETASKITEQIIRREIIPASSKNEHLALLERRVRSSILLNEERIALSALWEAVSLTRSDPERVEIFHTLALEQAKTALTVGDLNVAGEALATLTGSGADTHRIQPNIDAAAALLAVKRNDPGNALSILEKSFAANPTVAIAELRHAQAEALARLGRLDEALTTIDQATAAAGNPHLLVQTLISRCKFLRRLGNSQELEQTAENALNIAREHRMHKEQANLYIEHALTLLTRGDFVKAEDELIWAAILCLSMNEISLVIDAYVELSNSAVLDGRYADSDIYANRAYLHARALTSPPETASAFRRLGWSALVKGNFQTASSYLEEAEGIAKRFSLAIIEAACMSDRARLAFLAGDNINAETLARASREKFKADPTDPHALRPAELLLDILFACGRYSEVPEELEAIVTVAAKVNAHTVSDAARLFRAKWLTLMGRRAQAASELGALSSSKIPILPFLLIRIAEVETSLALAAGDIGKARRVLEQLGSRRFGVATPLERLEWELLLCQIERIGGDTDGALRRVAFLAGLPFVPGSAFYRHRLLLAEGTALAVMGGVNMAQVAGILQQAADEAAANGYKPIEEEAFHWLSGVYAQLGNAETAETARNRAEQAAAILKLKLSEEDARDFGKALAERRSRRPIRAPGIPQAAPAQTVAPQQVPPPPVQAGQPADEAIRTPKTGDISLPSVEEAAELTYEGFTQIMSRYEKAYIEEVLAREGGNRLQAAKKLGISRAALYRILNRLGIS